MNRKTKVQILCAVVGLIISAGCTSKVSRVPVVESVSNHSIMQTKNIQFQYPLELIETDNEAIELLNVETGCVLVLNRELQVGDACKVTLASGDIPIYKILKHKSKYVFAYGDEIDLSTGIFDTLTSQYSTLHGYSVECVLDDLLVVSEASAVDQNQKLFSYGLENLSFDTLNVNGQMIRGHSSDEVVIAVSDSLGNTNVGLYTLSDNAHKRMFTYKNDIYLVGFDVKSNRLLFLGNNRSAAYMYDLEANSFTVIVENEIKSAVYNDLQNILITLDHTHTVSVYYLN